MKVALKDGVKITGRHFEPEIYKIILAAMCTAPKLEDDTLYITAAKDGMHKAGSKHYTSEAFDIRIWNVKGFSFDRDENGKWHEQETIKNWAQALSMFLGKDYDIVYGDESHRDHIHAEFDPKP